MTYSKFPRKESDILALGQEIVDGMEKNPKFFSDPPIQVAGFKLGLEHYAKIRGECIEARAAAEQATKAKDKELQDLVSNMKLLMTYIEMRSKLDGFSLKGFGFSKPERKKATEKPGMCLSLQILIYGLEWLTLVWLKPTKGASFSHYLIYCRKPNGVWEVAGRSSKDTTINLVGQPRGILLEFKVVAVNAVGEGEDSNTVTIML